MPLLDCGFVDTATGQAVDSLVQHGPTLWVNIGFDPQFKYGDTDGNPPTSQVETVPALLDTGASESCIDEALAQSIGLPIVDRQMVSGVGGGTEVNIYLGHIVFPSLQYMQWGRFAGAKLADGNQIHRALIGRTMLRTCLMVYDGRVGRVMLAR